MSLEFSILAFGCSVSIHFGKFQQHTIMISVVIIIIERLKVHEALLLFLFFGFYDFLRLKPAVVNPFIKLSPIDIIGVIRSLRSFVVVTVVFKLFFYLNLLFFPFFELSHLIFFQFDLILIYIHRSL